VTNYRRNFICGGSFFFTANLAERRLRILVDHVDLLRQAFRHVRRRHPFDIEAIVVLPDHLHAIWTLPEGDADFALRWRLIKSMFSRGLFAGERRSPSRAKRANAAFGSGAIGSILCAMKGISRGMLTTSISIR
jgi:putative transposase